MSREPNLDRFGVVPNNRSEGAMELRMRCWIRLLRLMKFEARTRTSADWSLRRRAWRHGFCTKSWLLFDLDNQPPQAYVNDWKTASRQYLVNGFSNPIIGNKRVLSDLLQTCDVPRPEVVSMILNGRMSGPHIPAGLGLGEALTESLQRYPRQVFRPTWAGNGQGVFFVSLEGDELTLNRKAIARDELVRLLQGLDRYLATEFMQQADYAAAIFAGSTNTMRILTLFDEKVGEAFVAGASHRFGTRQSGLMDSFNGGAGGLCARIDLDRGVLSKAVSADTDGRPTWHSRHPDTGTPIEGVELPGFSRCIRGLLRAAEHFAYCPMIGWDVVVTNSDYAVIEANSLPSLTVIQVHTPLLRDRRSREFFARYGLT